MKLKYIFDGRIKIKGIIPRIGFGKLDIDVKHFETEGELPDEILKSLIEKAYEIGYDLGKEMGE